MLVIHCHIGRTNCVSICNAQIESLIKSGLEVTLIATAVDPVEPDRTTLACMLGASRLSSRAARFAAARLDLVIHFRLVEIFIRRIHGFFPSIVLIG